MKALNFLLLLLAAGGCGTHAGPGPIPSAAGERLLLIAPSSTAVAKGKITLTIGALRRVDGVYTGDYKIRVFPYFFKNDKGRLAISVPDAALAGIQQGRAAAVVGTATSGKNGQVRSITATATPANPDHGTLKLWFTAGDHKLIFEPAYHFATNGTTTMATPSTDPSRGARPAPPLRSDCCLVSTALMQGSPE